MALFDLILDLPKTVGKPFYPSSLTGMPAPDSAPYIPESRYRPSAPVQLAAGRQNLVGATGVRVSGNSSEGGPSGSFEKDSSHYASEYAGGNYSSDPTWSDNESYRSGGETDSDSVSGFA